VTEVIVVTSNVVDVEVDMDVVTISWEVMLSDVVVLVGAVVSLTEEVFFREASKFMNCSAALAPQLERQPLSTLQKSSEVPH
jgi:hypothetical protein